MRSYVYMTASKKHGTLYTGVPNDLRHRVYQHKEFLLGGFTQNHGVHLLVYYEEHSDIRDAIAKEEQLKKWNRAWKIRLIEKTNPDWRDSYDDL